MAVPEDAAEVVGDVVRSIEPDYTIIKSLGKGSFGDALLVRRASDGRRFVAKQIDIGAMSARDRRNSLTEVRIMRDLDHPNVVRYVDAFCALPKGTPAGAGAGAATQLVIIMEYAPNGDLWDAVREAAASGDTIPEIRVARWLVELLLALDYIHRRRVLHRDVKARNVFVSATGAAKLGDFGLSCALQGTQGFAHTVCGTPYYFAPELCAASPYSSAADVWAAGCVVYELCALKHPFTAKSVRELLAVIQRGSSPPTIPSPPYSAELSAVVAAMLTPDPQKRPTVAALARMPYVRARLKTLRDELRVPAALPGAGPRPSSSASGRTPSPRRSSGAAMVTPTTGKPAAKPHAPPTPATAVRTPSPSRGGPKPTPPAGGGGGDIDSQLAAVRAALAAAAAPAAGGDDRPGPGEGGAAELVAQREAQLSALAAADADADTPPPTATGPQVVDAGGVRAGAGAPTSASATAAMRSAGDALRAKVFRALTDPAARAAALKRIDAAVDAPLPTRCAAYDELVVALGAEAEPLVAAALFGHG